MTTYQVEYTLEVQPEITKAIEFAAQLAAMNEGLKHGLRLDQSKLRLSIDMAAGRNSWESLRAEVKSDCPFFSTVDAQKEIETKNPGMKATVRTYYKTNEN